MVKRISRIEYERSSLSDVQITDDPCAQFSLWWQDAISAQVYMIDAVHLATVDKNSCPDVRVVLLKDFDQRGFVFFTNYQSKKAEQIAAHPVGALNFFWADLERQVRVRGKIAKTSREESERYFHSRPRGAQIGAWVSPQSQPIENRSVLENAFADKEREFSEHEIPCPYDWGGYRLSPDYFEFWQGRSNRLHDRFSFERIDHQWRKQRLAP